jgi:dienelactone hydrolase
MRHTPLIILLLAGCASGQLRPNSYEAASLSERTLFKKVFLPLPPNTQFTISQGAFGAESHGEAGNQYSWDFDVPYGTAVVAVQSGKVIDVWEPNQGGDCDSKLLDFAHNIKIQHSDGTIAQYVHVQSRVKVGDSIRQGKVIAVTAKNGWICQPQLHFSVYESKDHLYPSKNRKTLPLFFEGVPDGIAKAGHNGVVPLLYEEVSFPSGNLTLGGTVYRPPGPGPFPTVLYNHGSAPSFLNDQAAESIAPYFLEKGWAFFMPYRRGQGSSQKSGPYIGDEIDKAKSKGLNFAASKMLKLLTTDHLADQMAALRWLKKQSYVDQSRIAVAGNSFGGIQSVLGAARGSYCAASGASGGAESWDSSSELQLLMKNSVRNSKCPIFFFQAENDYNLTPTKVLSVEMNAAGKRAESKIYPKYGDSPQSGHSFAYRGVDIWFPDVFAFFERECPAL